MMIVREDKSMANPLTLQTPVVHTKYSSVQMKKLFSPSQENLRCLLKYDVRLFGQANIILRVVADCIMSSQAT